MADTIQSTHPLRTLCQDSVLSCVLDLEDPFHMTLERLEGLIAAEPEGEIRAYLFGLYDMRRASVYAVGA